MENKIIQYDFIGQMLVDDIELVGKYHFPQVRPSLCVPDSMPIPFNYITSAKNIESKWFHFFIRDNDFERVWHNFWKYEKYIKTAKGLISTDFSLYRDEDEDLLIRNCYRNRVMACAMQKINDNIIPTAGFAGENTWDWCFDALPHHSSVAITTNGTLSDPEARRLFVGGVDALVKTVYPRNLVICGNFPKWIYDKYPSINIVPILSYSQMWHRRCG